MLPLYNPAAPRKATNLSINSDLLNKAREHGINLSATLEQALTDALKTRQQEQWLSENRSAIASYNADVEKNGSFADTLRSF
ncbi:MAG: type II toxin-antitoxin system CcdA family antitoxin [Moraxellaceae bacterium]